MSVENVLSVAANEIGYTEQPANSNKTKYGAEYGLDGQPWCVMFLWWCFKNAGEQNAFFAGAKTASCGILLRWHKEQGMTAEVPQPGDIVILNFSGTKDTQHCGIVESYNGGNMFTTIEGNTSGGGSQDNGGAVMRKVRYLSQVVGMCRPNYTEKPKVVSDYENHWAKDAIDSVVNSGLMVGDDTGKFRPNDYATRAELATVLNRLIERGDIH